MYTYIRGRKVSFTDHAIERTIERFKALSIALPNDEAYIELAISGLTQVLNNPFMNRYLSNLISKSNHHNEDVLVYDEVNKMIYAIAIKPYDKGRIVVKTVGTKHLKEWEYFNHDYQRICWIYDGVFKFSTNNGNITWF